MKDAAKKIGKQFACGSSVSKAPSGAEEIVVQGDVLMDLPGFLEATLKVRPCVLLLFFCCCCSFFPAFCSCFLVVCAVLFCCFLLP